ncbi:leucine-rich repeat domain-containing protein [Bacillus kexueae]|uniref:leucine-rich repeat domain-containing protein n=1 Tax=Aeribacillus kexueae TaxID=2078952 RepID=UPI001FAE99A9|nr:leucine-rich repeat domain-containing protein [Bacillus kexueae]
MNRVKWLNITVILTMLLTFLSPISGAKSVQASMYYELYDLEQVGQEVVLTWNFESFGYPPFERFEVNRNGEIFEVQPEIISEINDEGSYYSATYSYTDSNIEPNTAYTYEVIGWYNEQATTIGVKDITTTSFNENTSSEQSQEDLSYENYSGATIVFTTEEVVEVAWYEFNSVDTIYYELYVNGDLYAQLDSDVFQYLIEGLTPGTQYDITFKVVDQVGNELYQETLYTVTEEVENQENPPSDSYDALWVMEEYIGDTTTAIMWEYEGEETPVEFAIYVDGEFLDTTNHYRYELTNLEPSTYYFVTVEALNEFGELLAVDSYDLHTIGAIHDEFTEDEIFVDIYQLSNEAVELFVYTNSYDQPPFKFLVNGQEWDDIVQSAELFVLSGLTPSTNYEVEIQAINDDLSVKSETSISFKTTQSPSGEVVHFPDANLELAIKDHLAIDREIYVSDLEKLTYLYAQDMNISDLTGLEKAVNLKDLDLSFNQIEDLSPLQSLSLLESLALWGNDIKDITPLSNLVNLTFLDLSSNHLFEIDALSGLTNIRDLFLSQNQIQDLKPLENLTGLEYLVLWDNQIANVDALQGLTNLRVLDLDGNEVADLSPLTGLSNLQSLLLSGTLVQDIEPLMSLQNLQALYLNNTMLNEGAFEYIQQLTDKGVYVEFNGFVSEASLEVVEALDESITLEWSTSVPVDEIDRVEVYEGLNHLTTLSPTQYTYTFEGVESNNSYEFAVAIIDIFGNAYWAGANWTTVQEEFVQFTDANLEYAIREELNIFNRDLTTEDLKGLNYLNAQGYGIEDLTGLEHAVNLQDLDLSNNNIVDITPIAGLTSLTWLSLWNNQIQDLKPLENLKNLVYLDLDENRFEDISVLENLSNLEILWLSGNEIYDLQVLMSLSNLTDLYVWDIPLSEETSQLIEQLIEKGIYVEYNGFDSIETYMGIVDVTEESVTFEWMTTVPEQDIERIELYVNNEKQGEINIDEFIYTLEKLQPNTKYEIGILIVEKDGNAHWGSIEVNTNPTLENVADVRLVLEHENGDSIVSTGFSIEGLNETNQHIYKYGFVDEFGDFYDESGSDINNVLKLPYGQYEVIVYNPFAGEDLLLEIDIVENVDYVSEPIVITIPAVEQVGEVVEFADEKLEEVIRNSLWIHDRDLTTEDMKQLKVLYASDQGIQNLSGLEYAVNLEELFVSHNSIKDITPIAGLTSLKSLTLWENEIESIEQLMDLTNLTYLDLESNRIRDISVLGNLTGLEVLWLSYNDIENLEVVGSLPNLSELYLWGVELSEASHEIVRQLEGNGVYVEYEGFEVEEAYLSVLDVTEHSIQVEWYTSLPTDEIKEIEFYLNGEKVGTGNASELTFTYQDLEPDTEYELEAAVIDVHGNQYWAYNFAKTERPQEELVKVQFQAVNGEHNTLRGFEFSVTGTDERNEDWYMFGYTNDQGLFRGWYSPSTTFELPVGSYEVIVHGQNQYEDTIFEINLDKDQDYVANPIIIQVEETEKITTPLTIKVQNEKGNPITSVEYISLYSPIVQETFGYQNGFKHLWQVTNDNGEYEFEEVVVADEWNLYINAPGYKIFEDQISFNAEENEITVTMETGALIIGSVTTEDNLNVEGANYFVYGNQSYSYGYISGGELHVGGLYEEDLTLEVSMPGYKPYVTTISADAFGDGVTSVGTIELEREKYVHGYVTKDGNPQSNVYVYLYTDNNTWSSYWARTDANGYFKIRNVQNGTYTLKTEGYNLPSSTLESVAPSDELLNIILEQKGSSSFEGDGNSFATSSQTAVPGKQLEYSFKYQNNGTVQAEDVEVSFNFPAGVSIIEESALLNGQKATVKDGKVIIPNVEAGAKGKITFKAQISDTYNQETIVASATIKANGEEKTYSAPTNVLFVTLQAPATTAKADVKVYGTAKAGSTVKVFDGEKLLAETKVNGRWWYADVTLPVQSGQESSHDLVAKVVSGSETVVSQPVTISYEPSIPTLTDVTVTAGWNGDVKLNPYTGLATFAIVEYTPIDVKVAFDQGIDEGAVYFLGEKYELTKEGEEYIAQIPGTWSSYGEQLMEIGFVKDGHEVRLPLMEVIVLIDPSGYVFEGSMDNRLEGVTAVVEEYQQDGRWKQWNADFYGQVNPQITDEEGRYGWDVIQGDWRVVFSKDGYETYISRTVTVPPAETQLNVPLVRTSNPSVYAITPADGMKDTSLHPTVKVEFDRLMNVEHLQNGIRVVKASDGSVVSGNLSFEEIFKGYQETPGKPGYFEEDPTKELAKVVKWTASEALEPNTEYQIVVDATLEDYDGKVLGENVQSFFTTMEQQEKTEDNDGGSEQSSEDQGTDQSSTEEETSKDQDNQQSSESKQPVSEDQKDSPTSEDEKEANQTNKTSSSVEDGGSKGSSSTKEIYSSSDFMQIEAIAVTSTKKQAKVSSEQLKELKEKNGTIVIYSKGIELKVPANIFENTSVDVEISIEKLEDIKEALSPVYDFTIYQGKQKISQFSQPVTLVFDVDTERVNNPDNVKVYYWNEDKKVWEVIGGTYKDGKVTAETDHFSIYTVFESTQSELTSTTIEPSHVEGALPNTATSNYNWLLVGVLLMVTGAVLFFLQRRKEA